MNRTEFMRQLERLLSTIPESDRQDAIAYYNDYFDEAGAENEERVIRELGSPEELAKTIKQEKEPAPDVTTKCGENMDGAEQAVYAGYDYTKQAGTVGSVIHSGKQKKYTWLIVLGVLAVILLIGVPIYAMTRYLYGYGTEPFVYTEESDADGYDIDKDAISKLDIDLVTGILDIRYDDVDYISFDAARVPKYKCYVKDGTLYVEGGTKVVNQTTGKITITIPYGISFDEVDLQIGAGEANVEQLVATEMDIQVGAGKATVYELDVKELNAETGAGQLYAELVGSQMDYNYDIECGIGEIQIGDSSYGGIGSEQHVENPKAGRSVELECGIGEIQIDFQE